MKEGKEWATLLGSSLRPCLVGFILEMIEDSHTVTMEDQLDVAYGLSIRTNFDDPEVERP